MCDFVSEYEIPYCRRLLHADIFPQQLSRRCAIVIFSGVSGVACTSTGTSRLASRSVSAIARSSPKFAGVTITPSIRPALGTKQFCAALGFVALSLRRHVCCESIENYRVNARPPSSA